MNWAVRCFAAVAVSAFAVLIAGCPSNMCLVRVCKGDMSNCTCSWSTCPEGSTFDTQRNTCVCERGRVSLNGACLTIEAANRFCGAGSRYENYGCVRITCPASQELDLQRNVCLPKQQVDQVGQNMGVPIGQDQRLGCPPGLVLVIENAQTASCVPPQTTCARDEIWNGQACVKTRQCPPGTVLNTATNACITVAKEQDDQYTVQLASWVQATYGLSEGDGTHAFCSGFNKKPVTFGVLPGGSIAVLADVTVQAPNRNVSQALVSTSGTVQASRQPVTAAGATEIQRAAQELLASLVQQGGRADNHVAHTRVRCIIVNAAAPTAVPATGGL